MLRHTYKGEQGEWAMIMMMMNNNIYIYICDSNSTC